MSETRDDLWRRAEPDLLRQLDLTLREMTERGFGYHERPYRAVLAARKELQRVVLQRHHQRKAAAGAVNP